MYRTNNKGLALLVVMFIVALASMLVVNLTYSTYLGSRIAATAEKSVQAEYLLKSALNYAMVLIKEDIDPGDSGKDIWGKYANGLPLQTTDLINYTLPNIPVALEIRPEGAKLNIREVLRNSSITGISYSPTRNILARLFANPTVKVGFEFDNEPYVGPDGRIFEFTSKDLIANLIDYMDLDENPYNEDEYKGIEGPNSKFPNQEIVRIAELSAVPGFTASRVKRLLPYLTTVDKRQVNINLASKALIMSLDPGMEDAMAEGIIEFRKSEAGPIKNISDLQNLLPASVFDNIQKLVDYESNRFQVIAKVEYSTSVFFLRADLAKNGRKQLPDIKTLELF